MAEKSITVIYAHHASGVKEHVPFPEQTISSGQLTVLPVDEKDPFFRRTESLKLLGEVKSDYVMFLDEGDLISTDFLEKMRKVFSKAKTAFAVPCFENQYVGDDGILFTPGNGKNETVNLDFSLTFFPTELHGILFRTQELLMALHESRDSVETEKQILLCLLDQNRTYSYVGTRKIIYSQPKEYDYLYNFRSTTREWYFEPFEQFLLPLLKKEKEAEGQVRRFYQFLALFMVLCRLNANYDNRNKHVIAKEEVTDYVKLFTEVLQYVDMVNLLTAKSNMTSMDLKNKLFLVRLKKDDFDYYPQMYGEDSGIRMFVDGVGFGSYKNLNIEIVLMEYKNQCIEIDGSIHNYFREEDACLYAEFGNKKYPVTYNGRYTLSKCFGVSYYRKKPFHVSIPVENSEKDRVLNFYLQVKGMSYPLEYGFAGQFSRFSKKYNYVYWRFDHYLGILKKDQVWVIKAKAWKILYKEYRLWKQMAKLSHGMYRNQIRYKALSFLLQPWFARHKICLFMDKIYKGGDSSEYLYRYALTQKDRIRKYYLLDKDSADYARMKKEGYKPLVRGSLKHRLIFLNSDMIVASNSTVCAFNDYDAPTSQPFRGILHFGVACVQHGMSVQNIAVAQNRLRDNTKLYFCASPYEITNLSKPVYDYAGYDALKLTGVPRYDGLRDRAEKIILISPTWRMQSAMPVTKNEGVARDYNPNFKETDYYKVYNGLINDPNLLEAAKEYGYRIQYVLHPIVSPQAEDFEKNDFVEIIPAIGDMSYEKLFCEAALMVTDFSGVQFDFAYMRKPVVYLHHKDIPKHYEEGIFHYDTMGFGEICETNGELIDVLCDYMEKGCVMPELYRKRADDFFRYSDHNNCERIYPILRDYILNQKG